MQNILTGLETARQALSISQEAMDITSQNIANSSTTGYTRQRIVQVSEGPDTGGSKYASGEPNVGQGVRTQQIQQLRDTFLDYRYRTENSTKNKWDTLSDNLSQMEDIVNEFASSSTSTALTGLSGDMSTLLSNLKKLQATPDDENLASVVKSTMAEICQTVNTDANQLSQLQSQVEGDLKIDIEGDGSGGGVDAILKNISSLNRQIADYETGGQTANELRDQRNNYLDQLSGYFDVNITNNSDGMVSISLSNDSTYQLIDGNNTVKNLKVSSDGKNVVWDDASSSPATVTGGETGAYLTIINGDGTNGNYGIPAMQGKLNTFATQFSSLINGLVTSNNASGKLLLSATGAADMSVSTDWVNNDSLITDNYTGTDKADYVAQFVNLFSQSGNITYNDTSYSGTIQDFTDSISMDVANQLSYVKKVAASSDSIVKNLNSQRQSVSGVSIDEEGVNIIKYQQAYSAAARVVTAINDMLDTLIKSVE